MTYQRILVPVDGSDIATAALKEAVRLAKAFPSALCIMMVADEYPGYAESIPVNSDEYISMVREYGKNILTSMEKIAKQAGIQPDIKLVEVNKQPDVIPEHIIQQAVDWRADLIVLGTHGRKGISRLMLGSVAESVVRLAHTPVLLIKN